MCNLQLFLKLSEKGKVQKSVYRLLSFVRARGTYWNIYVCMHVLVFTIYLYFIFTTYLYYNIVMKLTTGCLIRRKLDGRGEK